MKKLLLNPFEKYTEKELFIFGLISTLLCAYIGYVFEARFDNIFHVSTAKNITFLQSLIETIANLLSIFIFLYPLGLIINKKCRVVDIINTVMVSRSLCLVLFLCIIIFEFAGINDTIINSQNNPTAIAFPPVQLLIIVIIAFIVLLPSLVWQIVLLYNGFKTATNLKSTLSKVYFAVALLLAYILSMILIYLLN